MANNPLSRRQGIEGGRAEEGFARTLAEAGTGADPTAGAPEADSYQYYFAFPQKPGHKGTR